MKRSSKLLVMLLLNLAGWGMGNVLAQPAPSLTGVPAGLTVDSRGLVCRNWQPYRGIGVNYFDAFMRTLSDPATTSYRADFQVLAAHKIPYARISLCGFVPNDYKVYINNKTEYFRRMDGVIKAAEDYKVGIIGSLFWSNSVCADIAGEHMDAYDDPTSKTYTFMRQYIDDVVGRYKNSPAIWGWECGNEYNLFNDLTNGADFLSTYTSQGCPATRDPQRDWFPNTRTNKLLSEFAKEVRRVDPSRIIVSGNSLPRGCAWHLTHYGNWTPDTKAQFGEVLRRDNPDPLNVICIHAYAQTVNEGFFADQKATYSDLLKVAKEAGALVKKPIYLGEFSAPSFLDNGQPNPDTYAQTVEILAAIEDNQIPLSAIWTFGRWAGWGSDDSYYNISATNARHYMLDLIEAANARIEADLKAGETGVSGATWTLFD